VSPSIEHCSPLLEPLLQPEPPLPVPLVSLLHPSEPVSDVSFAQSSPSS
jgi:hypothetical protein